MQGLVCLSPCNFFQILGLQAEGSGCPLPTPEIRLENFGIGQNVVKKSSDADKFNPKVVSTSKIRLKTNVEIPEQHEKTDFFRLPVF